MNITKFDRRWFMIDMARHYTFSRKEYTIMLDMLQNLGYNGIGMYFEGAFEFKSIPGVSREKLLMMPHGLLQNVKNATFTPSQ